MATPSERSLSTASAASEAASAGVGGLRPLGVAAAHGRVSAASSTSGASVPAPLGRVSAASAGSGAGAAGVAARGSALHFAPNARQGVAPPASQASVPAAATDLCYGARVGIRSCAKERYVAAFPRGGANGDGDAGAYDVEVAGYHPFRQGDVTDRAADCPSEWVVLHFGSRQHRGPIRLGDEVLLARELGATSGSERRRERYAYLALEPSVEGEDMEPTMEREVTDMCKWTLVGADEPESSGRLQSRTQLLIRGRYKECLALGRPLWDTVGPKTFRPPARASGWQLTCRGRDARAPELHFRLVKAGLPFGADVVAPSSAKAKPPPLPAGVADGLLAGRPIQLQEQLLLDDLLYCMLGAEGTYIRPTTIPSTSASASPIKSQAVRFEIDVPDGADASTVQFLRQMLPLCEHHAAVQTFVDVQGQNEHGSVNHALCAAIGELLREFSVKVGQLESTLRAGDLSIAKLWYHIQPSLDTFVVLHRVTSHVDGLIGGQVLNGIEEVMAKNSLTLALELCEYLLEQASRPYFEMVSRWVYEGRLDDPYGEFFVSESSRLRDERHGGPAADFWQKHFTLQDSSVPQFLAPVKEKILHAGKYIHVFLSAAPGKELPEPNSKTLLRYSRRQRDCVECIDAAYKRASAALLGLFMSPTPSGLDLPGRLRSMRSFFFLGKADWFGQLMDTAASELEQPAAEVPLARLESLLDLAIRASSAASDVYREDIFCGMHSFRVEDACNRMVRGHSSQGDDIEDDGASTRSVSSTVVGGSSAAGGASGPSSGGGVAGDASGVRCFTLKYRTSWPLSIVFSRSLLLKYQMIFRHLLFCKYVERKLVEVWVDHQYTKELGLDTDFSPSYSLRQRMLHFCREYIFYATIEVLEPQSHNFLVALSSAESVDEVLTQHEFFLATCLRELLLTEREALYKGLSKVLQTCLTFAWNLHRFSSDLHEGEGEILDPAQGGSGASSAERRLAKVSKNATTYLHLLSQRHYSNMISKFKSIFESQLQGFLRQIRGECSSRSELFLSNMLTRLDYNDYYSSVMTGVSSSPP